MHFTSEEYNNLLLAIEKLIDSESYFLTEPISTKYPSISQEVKEHIQSLEALYTKINKRKKE